MHSEKDTSIRVFVASDSPMLRSGIARVIQTYPNLVVTGGHVLDWKWSKIFSENIQTLSSRISELWQRSINEDKTATSHSSQGGW